MYQEYSEAPPPQLSASCTCLLSFATLLLAFHSFRHLTTNMIQYINYPYIHLHCMRQKTMISKRGMPRLQNVNISGVTLKMAFDENWAVADNAEEKSDRFTSPASLDLVHRLRRDSDCVLVGRVTVQRDNCTLTVRRVPLFGDTQQQPVRVVIDSTLSLLNSNETFAMFHDELETIVYCSQESWKEQCKNPFLKNDCVTLVPLPFTNKKNVLSVTSIVQDLKENQDIYHVMVEGGPATARLFLQEHLVDRAILIRAPVKFSKPVASHISTVTFKNAGLVLLGTTTRDGDVVEYWSRPELKWPTENVADWP